MKETIRKLVAFQKEYGNKLRKSDKKTIMEWRRKIRKMMAAGERNGHCVLCPLSEYDDKINVDVPDSCMCCLPGFIEEWMDKLRQDF